MQSIQNYWQRNIQSCNFCWGSASWQPARVHRILRKHAPTRIMDHRIKECVKEDENETCQISAHKCHFTSSTDDRSTRRATWWTSVPQFTLIGVDYFGPSEIKFLRRNLKRWCCLFTCLTRKAVQIEVAQSLNIE